MYDDSYFPNHLVDKGREILLTLCSEIEKSKPTNLDELYKLTHSATNKFNDLQKELLNNDSEIDTIARECIALDFEFIATAYKYEADMEELIAPRDW